MDLKIAILSSALVLFFNFVQSQPSENEKYSTVHSSTLTFQIISAGENTFGYDIYKGEKKLIHQTTVPGVSGTKGFKNRVDAEKVASLVIRKLKSGESLPTVSVDELKKLDVIN